MSNVMNVETETMTQVPETVPVPKKWKDARPDSKRGAAALIMRAMEGRPADEVIAAIDANPEHDYKKGEARAFYNWCAENGFGPGTPTARTKKVTVAGAPATAKYRPASKDVTLAQIGTQINNAKTPEAIKATMAALTAQLKQVDQETAMLAAGRAKHAYQPDETTPEPAPEVVEAEGDGEEAATEEDQTEVEERADEPPMLAAEANGEAAVEAELDEVELSDTVEHAAE